MAKKITSESTVEQQERESRDVGRRRGRWWIHGLLSFGVLALVGSGAFLMVNATETHEASDALTHTITRGDLLVTVTEQGRLESSENTEIKCKVRGQNTVIWVVESGTYVEPGDELVRLDTLFIEEQIAERTKYAHWSRSGAERSAADVKRSKLAIAEYEEGRFVAELMSLQKDLAIAESSLRTAKNLLAHAEMMAESGYVSELELEERRFAVKRGELEVEGNETSIEVLEKFTKAEQMESLRGNLAAVSATHEANVERAEADASRRDRAVEELGYCVVKAERAGMVIHPSAARWKNAPEIEEGATVHKDQILLLMPDLSSMQVTIGVHESVVDRVATGLEAIVTLPDKTMSGEVASVASVTSPAGWWTGNRVTYETIVQLPAAENLKPGMSAEVEVILARHDNVLSVPVAAVVETKGDHLCWVRTADGPQRRALDLGDSNDVFIVVNSGLQEGDDVILNPVAYIEEAQREVQRVSSEKSTDGDDRLEEGDAADTQESSVGST